MHARYDAKTLRALSSSPWRPGKQDGQAEDGPREQASRVRATPSSRHGQNWSAPGLAKANNHRGELELEHGSEGADAVRVNEVRGEDSEGQKEAGELELEHGSEGADAVRVNEVRGEDSEGQKDAGEDDAGHDDAAKDGAGRDDESEHFTDMLTGTDHRATEDLCLSLSVGLTKDLTEDYTHAGQHHLQRRAEHDERVRGASTRNGNAKEELSNARQRQRLQLADGDIIKGDSE